MTYRLLLIMVLFSTKKKKKKKAVEDRHPQVSSERKVMEREKDESCKSDGKEGRMMRVKKNRIYL